MHCPNCGTEVGNEPGYCPNCGTRLEIPDPSATVPYASVPQSPAWSPAAVPIAYQPEELIKRIVAYIIDLIPIILFAFVHLLPILGWMFFGLVHACYWLFRDINGASLGKIVMGSVVTNYDGTPSTTNQRITRNIPLAIPGFVGMIPILGIFFEVFLAAIIFGTEALVLLVTGRRFGDRLAGTIVCKK